MVMPNCKNQKNKMINVIWNQNGAWTNHKLTWSHKIHHNPNSGGHTTFLLIIYFIAFVEVTSK